MIYPTENAGFTAYCKYEQFDHHLVVLRMQSAMNSWNSCSVYGVEHGETLHLIKNK